MRTCKNKNVDWIHTVYSMLWKVDLPRPTWKWPSPHPHTLQRSMSSPFKASLFQQYCYAAGVTLVIKPTGQNPLAQTCLISNLFTVPAMERSLIVTTELDGLILCDTATSCMFICICVCMYLNSLSRTHSYARMHSHAAYTHVHEHLPDQGRKKIKLIITFQLIPVSDTKMLDRGELLSAK